jgi:hypothetical protein
VSERKWIPEPEMDKAEIPLLALFVATSFLNTIDPAGGAQQLYIYDSV